ncbi:MAG: aldose 1-epimerase family protein [Clostridiales bacterium]|nr:aldose 1-epimerase family protein [Clostridiales bacterium]
MIYTLENEILKLSIASHGAELTSVIEKASGREFMWNAGDAWKRHSPVLFPIVGGLVDKKYRLGNTSYEMGQHGFARDMEFELINISTDEISFVLRETEETLKIWPFKFELILGYKLCGNTVKVLWSVKNTNNDTLHFSIGGHPAFMCPVGEGAQEECFLHFDEENPDYFFLSDKGLLEDKKYTLKTDGGYVNINHDFFNNDAYIMYNDRTRSVSLAGPDRKDYLKVTFDAPVYGIWSAKGAHAPFVCIEPWFGRCDRTSFKGSWEEREYDNTLAAGEIFNATYDVTIL